MESVLITGADGFIGSHLTDEYLNHNYNVIALKRPKVPIKNLNHLIKNSTSIKEIIQARRFKGIPSINPDLTLLECDLNDKNYLESIISHFKPQILLHFGAQSLVLRSWEAPHETFRTNVIGTINIFEAVKKHNLQSRIIVACSSAEYGTTTKLNRPLKEEDPLLAIHPYGISKVAVELLSRQYYINFGIDSINLRLFNQTGPRKTDDACSDFVREIVKIELGLKKPEIQVGNLNTYRDITGIQDTIQAISLAVSKGTSGETYNVCSGRKIKIRDVLNIVLSFSSKKIKIKEQFKEKLRKTDEDIIIGDNAKIKTELGWKISIPLETVLKQMYDYWMETYKNS
jgi:GDP-4-dehydro-6-deoxy-D-mannose reductase